MEPNKGLGGSLIDVFDAAVNLIKTEAGVLGKRAADTAKAKGVGVVLLLSATGPLILGLIFIILAVFYGLMRLGLGAWAAALFIALASFGLTGVLVIIGLRRLSAPVKADTGSAPDYDLKVPYTAKVSDLKGDPELVGGRARVTPGQQQGGVQTVHLHGGAKVEGTGRSAIEGRDKQDIVPSTPQAGNNSGDGPVSGPTSSPVSGPTSSTDAGHHGQKLEGAGPQVPDKSRAAQAEGIPVSTKPTYKEEMKKGGY
ncbi:phage holin family protein [Deinococcus sp.]|uniref:phage holin family protein n=1 Tax=Deinococcus sp. TaxID=47478 RepID=UPI0025E36138|nr:phage holin family protein [Deinococcus sp.]